MLVARTKSKSQESRWVASTLNNYPGLALVVMEGWQRWYTRCITASTSKCRKCSRTFSELSGSIRNDILLLCAAIRILASRSISMAQARVGQEFLCRYSNECLALGIHLVINHHMSVHYLQMIKLWGPVYSWWLFAFERFNGMLERVNTNGKDGGRSELTLMRNWIMTHLVYDLLLSLPEDAHPLERKFLNQIIKSEARERGSMMAQIAVYQAEANAGESNLTSGLQH